MFLDEAVLRLKLLEVSQNIIDSFLNGKVPSSFEMSNEDITTIKQIEKEYSCVIYYALKTDLRTIGTVLYFLNVCHYTEDWKTDRQCIKMMCPIVISYAPQWLPGNHIEIGSIYIDKISGHIELSQRNFQY